MAPDPTPAPTAAPNAEGAGALGFTEAEIQQILDGARANAMSGTTQRMVPYSVERITEGEHGGPAYDYAVRERPRALDPVDAVKLATRQMMDDELQRLAQEMVKANLLGEDYTRAEVDKVWAQLVDWAADWHEANPASRLTPEDMIEVYAGQRGTEGIGSKRKPGDPGGPSVTDVTRSVQLSDTGQAWGMLRQMIKSELGRNPTDAEVDGFQAALNDAQRRAPQVTNRTTRTDLSGNQTVNTTTSGGVDAQSFGEEYIEKNMDEEYGSYQAATTYMNAFYDAIGRTV